MVTIGKIAVIGGSGIHDSPLFEDLEWKLIETDVRSKEGDGKVEYQEKDDVIFIPRHGRTEEVKDPETGEVKKIDKRYAPSVTQYAANIVAAKMLGARAVIAASAVGSLRSGIKNTLSGLVRGLVGNTVGNALGIPKRSIPVASLVIPDDYVDESGRNDNIFGAGLVVHTNPRPAFSEQIRAILIEEALRGDYFTDVFTDGTYVTIPGNRFGTTAEGKKRSRYADVVGMTACPEASMAMQLGLHYALAAFPVDIDTDANHEHGTLAIMQELSVPERVPAYIAAVVNRVRAIVGDLPPLTQLQGNLIPGDTERIENKNLRTIANELIKQYC